MANGTQYPREWENVNDSLQRLKIPHGWLLRSFTTIIIGDRKVVASEALETVADHEKEWELERGRG